MFSDYLDLGWDHILDLQGYDHILFVIAMCALYAPSQWKKIALLVTAFTVGHSLTLAMSALDLVAISSDLVEFLIPITILATAFYNIRVAWTDQLFSHGGTVGYMITLFFGLIHGLGFSSYFKAILGQEEDILMPLFAFNIGVEVGQLVIVSIYIIISLIALNLLAIKQKWWTILLSLIAAIISTWLAYDKLLAFFPNEPLG